MCLCVCVCVRSYIQGGSKLERARDLFEQCLDGCPDKFAKGMSTVALAFSIPEVGSTCVALW